MDPTQDRSEIAFFDLETTFPTDHGQCSILEFGAILVCPKKFEELRSYSTLVRPADPSLISTLSARRNGITPDAVATAPTFADIADTVFEILHGRIRAGHNILGFDCEKIIEAFAEIGRPPPEPKGTIDSLPLLTQRFGRRADGLPCNYFGLGQQTHRSLDDVRMNLEVLKYCAAVLFLESSLPESNVKSSPEGTSQNLRTPSSKFKFENASHASPPDQGKDEIHQRFSLLTQGSGDVDYLAVTTADQPIPSDMSQLGNQMETEEIELCCSRLKIKFGISTKFADQAGRPRLNFVVDTCQTLCTVLYACEAVAKKLVEDYGSRSKWMPVVTRFNPPTARLHIPTEVFGDFAKYGTEMYKKEASGNIQKLVFHKYDPAELDSLLKPGTFVDAFLSLDPYDYKQRAGIQLVAKKLIIHSE